LIKKFALRHKLSDTPDFDAKKPMHTLTPTTAHKPKHTGSNAKRGISTIPRFY